MTIATPPLVHLFLAAGVVVMAVTGCASSASVGSAYDVDAGAETGRATADTSAAPAAPSPSDGTTRRLSDGATSAACGSALNGEGCPCATGSNPRACYLGSASQAGQGSCSYGQQSCVSHSEGGGTWGACTGQGAPTTCTALQAACGSPSDGCGGLLVCGTCAAGTTCGPSNTCGTGPCSPTSCADQGLACGPASDGCGGTLDCGSCSAPDTCGAKTQGQCGCTPTTCEARGFTCGSLADECGGTLDCGACVAPDTCGGGGTPGLCGGGTFSCTGYDLVYNDEASCVAGVAACGLSGTCSFGGGCCADGTPPGTDGCVSANPSYYGACIAATMCHACPS